MSKVFDSKAFNDWQRSREAKHKVDNTMITQLNNLITAIGQLGKAMSSR